jgi:hypothetical protein
VLKLTSPALRISVRQPPRYLLVSILDKEPI